MKTVVIGNGIIALTTALRLAIRAKAGDKVVIVGKLNRPGCATMAAGAMLASFCEIEEDMLNSPIEMFHWELSYNATRVWPKFVLDHLEIAMKHKCLVDECAECMGPKGACYELGTYFINNRSSDSFDDANYNAVIKALKDYDEPYTEVDPAEIPNYKPFERHRAAQAIYIPNEGWLNPKLTLRSIEASLLGFECVELIDDEVDNLVAKNGVIDHVVLKNGNTITGDKFLLATGATVTDVLNKSKLGLEIPRIFSSVGVSVQIRSPRDPHTKVIRTPGRGLACGLYTVPFYTGPKVPLNEIVIGSTSFISPTRYNEAKVGAVQYLLTAALEQINSNFYRSEITAINVGSRPISADTYPVLGKTSIPNLIIATGTRRDGFHLSPVLSEALEKMIYDEEVDPQYEFFKPERKLHRNLTRQFAIESGVKHLMSAHYQHEFVPSHDRITDKLREWHRRDLEELHDKVGATDWGIPIELIDMYRYGHISN